MRFRLFMGSVMMFITGLSEAVGAESLNPFAEREGPLLPGRSKTAEDVVVLTLQGTLVSADQPLANIDGVLYGMGDAIGGYTISEIRADSVTLSRGDSEIALHIEADDPPQQDQ